MKLFASLDRVNKAPTVWSRIYWKHNRITVMENNHGKFQQFVIYKLFNTFRMCEAWLMPNMHEGKNKCRFCNNRGMILFDDENWNRNVRHPCHSLGWQTYQPGTLLPELKQKIADFSPKNHKDIRHLLTMEIHSETIRHLYLTELRQYSQNCHL